MVNRSWMKWATTVLVGSAASACLMGCGDDAPASATCPEENMVWRACAGVPTGNLCGDETCTADVACASVLDVASDAELASAAAAASRGTCITLTGRRYGAVTLPDGVSLLGRSAAAVRVEGITLEAGNGAVLRGLTVGREGVRVLGATGVRIDSVRIAGERDHASHGVTLDPGSSVAIVASEIANSGGPGIFAVDADVTVEESVVRGAQEGGIRIQGPDCGAECKCMSRPALNVKRSVIRENHLIGIMATGAAVTLEGVDVIDTREGDAHQTGQLGGGISVSECSHLLGERKVRVLDSRDWGILVDRSTAALGKAEEDDGTIEISRNRRGLWIQNVCQRGGASCVSLHNGQLDGNFGVGIGITGQSRGVILCRSAVTATALDALPVFDGRNAPARDDVGDGVDWLDRSDVFIEELTLSGNARQSLLLDGPAQGFIGTLHLTGDAEKPPVQQNFTTGDQPEGLRLTTTAERTLTIPQSPVGVEAAE